MRAWGSALLGIGLGVVLVTALGTVLATPAAAQRPEVYKTADGSRFLLVPMDTHVVHWLNLTPARLGDEPEAYPGLALAIARASLLGRSLPGNAKTRDDNSPLAWERALRAAPSTGSRLTLVEGHLGIHVTFPAWSFGRVAQLVRIRARRDTLERLTEHFEQVRRERKQRLQQTPDLELIRRALDATDANAKSGSWMARGSAEHLDSQDAMAFYRWAYHPDRTIHVIVGKFRPAAAKNALDVLFDQPVAAAAKPKGKTIEAKRITSKRKASRDGLLAVYGGAMPAELTPRDVDVLTQLLAGSEDAFLPDYLRAKGHPDVRVEARLTPTRIGRSLLVHVRRPGAKIDADHRLVAAVREALEVFRTRPATEVQVQRALAAERSLRAASLANPLGLAEFLARHWIRTGDPMPELDGQGRLRERTDPSAAALRDQAAKAWPKAHETILTEVAR